MKTVWRYLKLSFLFMKKTIKGMLVYRWSFLINCISQALDYSVTFLLMWIMISAFEYMNGWNAYEVMLLYSFSLFSYGIAGTFFFQIMNLLPSQIRQGAFDDVLVKPVKLLPYLISSSFICNYIAHMTLSFIVMSVCFRALKIRILFPVFIKIIGILFFGSLIYAGFFLIVGGAAFLVARINSLFHIMYFFREVSYYPISIFPRLIQIIVTVLVPYGFINFYPLQELLEKNDFIFHEALSLLAPAVSILFFALACLFFIKSSKHYKSSGS